jgi:hypothetical protein
MYNNRKLEVIQPIIKHPNIKDNHRALLGHYYILTNILYIFILSLLNLIFGFLF